MILIAHVCPPRFSLTSVMPSTVATLYTDSALSRQDRHHARRYNFRMAGRECHHCKEWIGDGEAHDCWTTTEAALTADLSEDLKDAWERLRETAAAFGDQRIYASGSAIMFSRKSCYFFVRPKRAFLQVCVFLGRAIRAPQVRRVETKSTSKLVNIIHITHRDEVESPFVEWLREAYDLPDKLIAVSAKTPKSAKTTVKLTRRRRR
jgi:hypothetical protein